MQLAQTGGWKTLMAILESYGERPSKSKRPWPVDEDDEDSREGTPSEHLAKRFKQAASIQAST